MLSRTWFKVLLGLVAPIVIAVFFYLISPLESRGEQFARVNAKVGLPSACTADCWTQAVQSGRTSLAELEQAVDDVCSDLPPLTRCKIR